MKIAAIVQRYGPDIVGGAESLCRGVAEGLVQRGHEVEVMTTCARSYQTWANSFHEGVEYVNEVLVRRYRVEQERDMAAFNAASARLFGVDHGIEDQRAWVREQGPYTPHLVDHLHEAATDFDRLLFFTYLYYPTVFGIHVAPERSVLVPTAHDEAPIYLEVYESVFASPAGLIFNTEAEAGFVRKRFPHLAAKSTVAGVGIEHLDAYGSDAPGPGSDAPIAAAGEATVLYAGRIEEGKGVGEMLGYLSRFRGETGADLRIRLMGELAMQLPDEDWIETLGYVSEADKIRHLQEADVLIAPSALESFGIVVLEAMSAGTPALCNADSAAFVEHCGNAGGGLYYRGYAEFRAALELLLADDRLRAAMARKGASYVRENYSWPEIARRYDEFLAAL